MLTEKVQYKRGISVIQKKFALDKKISYDELEAALALRSPIDSKEIQDRGILVSLNIKLAQYRLSIKDANQLTGSGKITGNRWYNIYELVEKSDTEKTESINVNTAMQALEKDNQKLFLQNEELQEECNNLRHAYEILSQKEKEYKKIIASFYTLAMT